MLTSFFLWLLCFWFNRYGSIVPWIGGGCFGGKKQPTYTPAPSEKVKTAAEINAEAVNNAKTNMPLAYGAREGALSDIASGNEFYNKYQPLSIEQALSDQYFKNVMPTAENKILNYLSLAGISNSPITARLIGDQWGKTGFDVGSYLANQGNERARYSLSSRLNIDPNSITQPYQNLDLGQSNLQSSQNYAYAQQLAEADYMKQMADYQNKQARNKALMTIGGVGLGALGGAMFLPALMGAAPAMSMAGGGIGTATGGAAMSAGTGALMGGSLGAGIGGMFGGGSPPVSLGDSMSLANSFRPQTQNVWSGNSGGGLSIEQLMALMKAGVLK